MTQQISVDIYQPNGITLIAHVPRRRNVTWLNELNTPGTGQFDLHLDDQILVDHPTLIDGRNVVIFTRTSDSHVEKVWVIQDHSNSEVSSEEKAGNWVTVTGRGVDARAELSIIYPIVFNQPTDNTVRAFNFASAAPLASWSDLSLWTNVVGSQQATDPSRPNNPKPWFDPSAQWIWSTDPTLSAPAGWNWFRASLDVPSDSTVIIDVAADNFADVWLDEQRIIWTGDTWRKSYSYTVQLSAGLHQLAAAVYNGNFASGGPSPAGFLLSAWTLDHTYTRDTNLLRTEPGPWAVKAYDPAPGWTIGDIIRVLFGEATFRGTTDLAAITLGFDGTNDSNGDPWPAELDQDVTLPIGDDLLKTLTESTELVCDIWMDGLTLNAAPHRGSDLSGTVAFTAGEDVLAATPTFRGGPLRNVALIRFANQYILVEDGASVAEHGRREVYLELGNATSSGQATTTAQATFVETAHPEIQIPLAHSSAKGPQPGTDFNIGDVITAPSLIHNTPGPGRAMSITGTEGEGVIMYDSVLYPA